MRKAWIWALVVAAFLTRFLCLEYKPIHFDESINGWFLLQMKTLGMYKYDPQNYHGPLYFYMLQAWTAVWGENLFALRAMTSLFSFAAVMFFLRRSWWTAFFLLLSPSLIFFGRSAIHEMPFVFAQMLFFVGLYEYQKEQRLSSLWCALLGFLGMASLKETFVVTGFATVLAICWSFPWKAFVKDMWEPMRGPIIFVIMALAALFSGFGKNIQGVADFFGAFAFWSATGVTSGHNKSFWYWTELALQAEPLLLLPGLLALGLLFVKKYRSLSLFALSGWFIYSLIPYKTPWCMISWAWPFYYLLGEVFADLQERKMQARIPMGIVAALLVALGIKSSWPAIYQNPIYLEHPFVYVNSTSDFKRIDDYLQASLRNQPELKSQTIQISMDETWPLPWTLHESQGLRYDRFKDVIHPDALAYFCEIEEADLLDKTISERYVSITMPLRQFGRKVRLFLRKDIFKEFP